MITSGLHKTDPAGTLSEPCKAGILELNGLLRRLPRVKSCPAAGGIDEPRCLAFERFQYKALPVSPPSLSWQFFASLSKNLKMEAEK